MTTYTVRCNCGGLDVQTGEVEDVPEIVRSHMLGDCPGRVEAGIFALEPQWMKEMGGSYNEDGTPCHITYRIGWWTAGAAAGRILLDPAAGDCHTKTLHGVKRSDVVEAKA